MALCFDAFAWNFEPSMAMLINVNYFCRLTTTILAGRRHVHGDGLGDVLVRFGRGVLPAEVRGWVGSEEMAGGAG